MSISETNATSLNHYSRHTFHHTDNLYHYVFYIITLLLHITESIHELIYRSGAMDSQMHRILLFYHHLIQIQFPSICLLLFRPNRPLLHFLHFSHFNPLLYLDYISLRFPNSIDSAPHPLLRNYNSKSLKIIYFSIDCFTATNASFRRDNPSSRNFWMICESYLLLINHLPLHPLANATNNNK